jgi:hypothetical protein
MSSFLRAVRARGAYHRGPRRQNQGDALPRPIRYPLPRQDIHRTIGQTPGPGRTTPARAALQELPGAWLSTGKYAGTGAS